MPRHPPKTPLSHLIVLISNVDPHTDDTVEKTSFILKTCPDDDAVRHHGLGEWLPPSGKPLRSLETNPFFTMSIRLGPALLQGNPYGVAIDIGYWDQSPNGESGGARREFEPTTSRLQS